MQMSGPYSETPKRRASVAEDRGTLARGLRLLSVLAEAGQPVGLTELAVLTGFTKPTVHRLAKTLVGLGYVEQASGTSDYSLRPKILALGHSYLEGLSLRELALPVMHRLADQFGENVSLAVLDGSDVVYVERLETRSTGLSFKASIGSRAPVHCTSLGKAILAWLPDAERSRLLDDCQFKKYSEFTITDRTQLEEVIGEVRERGFAIADQEKDIGICAIAVPILDRKGLPIGAINVGGPSVRLSREALEGGIAPILMKYVGEISFANPTVALGGA